MDNEIEELAKKRKCQTSTQIESKKLRPVEGEDEMSAESTSQRDEHAEEEPQEIREEQGLVDENDRKAEASKSKKDENVGQTDREEKQCVDDENGDHKKVEASNSKKDENVVQTEGEEKQCVDDGNGDQKKMEPASCDERRGGIGSGRSSSSSRLIPSPDCKPKDCEDVDNSYHTPSTSSHTSSVLSSEEDSDDDNVPKEDKYDYNYYRDPSISPYLNYIISSEEEEDEEEDDDAEENGISDPINLEAYPNISDIDSKFETDSIVNYLSFDSSEGEDDDSEGDRSGPLFTSQPKSPSVGSSANAQSRYKFFRAPPDPLPTRVPFTGKADLLQFPMKATPFGFFEMLASDAIDLTRRESNKHGEKLKTEGKLEWFRPVTRDEIRKFLGLFFHMGFPDFNGIREYWTSENSDAELYKKMSCNRFLQILRLLNFNADHDSADDILAKIRPLLNYFNNRMDSVYRPGRELFIPQPLVLWKGGLVYRQYILDKEDEFGIKMFSLVEPSGLVLKFHMHSGRYDSHTGGKNHIHKIINKLLEGKHGRGHSLFVGIYYNSVDLVVKLLEENTYCSGPVIETDKHFPKDVRRKKLKHREMTEKFSNQNVSVVKWIGLNKAYFVSSEFSGLNVTKRGLPIPNVIQQYNQVTDGFDYEDELVPYYSCIDKVMYWYLKVGLHIFQLMLMNAFFLYKSHKKSHITFFKFKKRVIEKLIGAPKGSL